MHLLKDQHHGPGRRSAYTIYRGWRQSHHRRRAAYYVKKFGTRPKGYAKQAKGFREWAQTPTQLARLNANLAASAAEKRSDAPR